MNPPCVFLVRRAARPSYPGAAAIAPHEAGLPLDENHAIMCRTKASARVERAREAG